MNECLVVSWTSLWGLIKVYYLDFTWRLSPRRMCPRRMSPRRKAETDIPETGGTDGWRRLKAMGGKAWTEGSSVFMAFRSRDIFLSFFWPSQSRRRMVGDGWLRDGCPRDGGRPPETEVPETVQGRPRRRSPRRWTVARDGGPRDCGRPRRMSPRWMSPRLKVFFLKHYVRF